MGLGWLGASAIDDSDLQESESFRDSTGAAWADQSHRYAPALLLGSHLSCR